MPEKTNRISFQGEPGANSDTASRNMFPHMVPLPCPTFEDAFNAVETNKADLAMIPIENTIAGRVADIHHLLPESRMHIVGEYFLPIHFQLMVLPGVKREEIKTVHSHIHALGQCRKYIRKNGWKAVVAGASAATVIGVWACGRHARKVRLYDPSECVLDEVAGQWFALIPVALAGRGHDWRPFLMAFLLFRLFDIWKPWPVASFERLPGGFGIMMDDVAAGLIAAGVLYGMLWIRLF